ncbi:MAG: AAA family ATPase [Pirellulaceae bacterium]|nr:AAA family ATPase [Pirellulaceae bacterium]
MTSRLHRIEITNFKAFRQFTLEPEGRHLLIYGGNGSGKSSLYWALYTFLQSARKSQGGIKKYFDPTPENEEQLLNIHEQSEPAPRDGSIALTFREQTTKIDTRFEISKNNHGTFNHPFVLKGDLASDFITYRFFFGFSDFRHSTPSNIWRLFEKEILPFCVSTGGKNPLTCWNEIESAKPNPLGTPGIAGAANYDYFHRKTADFASMLASMVDTISTQAQHFYDSHFAHDDQAKLSLQLIASGPISSGGNQGEFRFEKPKIQFGIQIDDGNPITRPQSFLNEAKMTQIALSVRFAASLVNLHESDLKLLVLDDLLVSLDMSNRMKVVEILLSNQFEGYQQVVLTHDLGFFREFERCLGAHRNEWYCVRLKGTAREIIVAINEKNDLQKAEEFLAGFQLDEAALSLRKAAEKLATRYRELLDRKSLPSGEFFTLTENLRAARNKLLAELPFALYEKVLKCTPKAHLGFLLPSNEADIDAVAELQAAEKGILKAQRRRLRQVITDDQTNVLRRIELIDDILACTGRVLNPAAHAGDPPIYEAEVINALSLIQQLEQDVTP